MSKHKTLTIPYELWEWLRARAYERKTSMVEVLRGMMFDAVKEKAIEKHTNEFLIPLAEKILFDGEKEAMRE